MRFFPTSDVTMVVAGSKSGHLGFWNVKPRIEKEDNVVTHLYQPHSGAISGISIHPFSLSKMYSSCNDGILRLMDIDREEFDLLYSSSSRTPLVSLAQDPNDANLIYLGEGEGGLSMFDGRVGKISNSWSLHETRINSIDFSPANTNVVATSSTDHLACLWDLRKIDVRHPKCNAFQTFDHTRAVYSAYFSPSGSCLATTRATWGWDDTYLYKGYMKRRVHVLSATEAKAVHKLESSLIPAIPCVLDAHPCVVGMLACANRNGNVFIWTTSS